MAKESEIKLNTTKTPEFDGWRWVSFWYPVRQVVSFKRDVYRKVMKEFAQVLMNETKRAELEKSQEERAEKRHFRHDKYDGRKNRFYKGKR